MTDNFSKRIGVLIVHNDPTCLSKFENIFLHRKYKVIECKLFKEAWEVLNKNKSRIDIVICDINDETDGFKIIKDIASQMKITVAMMPVDAEVDKLIQVVECLCIHEDIKITIDGVVEDVKVRSHGLNMKNEKKQIKESSEESPRATKKLRVVWNTELHQLFVEAVNSIGIDAATPKMILDRMGIDWLTRDNVASHLQKYRQGLLREHNSGMALAVMGHQDMPHHNKESLFNNPEPVANNMIKLDHSSVTSLPQLDWYYPSSGELTLMENFQIPASHDVLPDLTNIVPPHAYIPQPSYQQNPFHMANSSHQHSHIYVAEAELTDQLSDPTFSNPVGLIYQESPMPKLPEVEPSHQQGHLIALSNADHERGHLTNPYAFKTIQHAGESSQPSHDIMNRANPGIQGSELKSIPSLPDNMDFIPNLIL